MDSHSFPAYESHSPLTNEFSFTFPPEDDNLATTLAYLPVATVFQVTSRNTPAAVAYNFPLNRLIFLKEPVEQPLIDLKKRTFITCNPDLPTIDTTLGPKPLESVARTTIHPIEFPFPLLFFHCSIP